MRLKLMTPLRVEIDEAVEKVSAEGLHGSFTLLPRHLDLVAALTPSLLSYVPEGGGETHVAVDGGTLMKCGDEVLVSSPSVVGGRELGELQQALEESYRQLDQDERRAQSALQRIEADFIRRVVEAEEDEYR